jgi:hypothetical protein
VSGSHSSEVEHFIGNEEVSGSNPDVSTTFALVVICSRLHPEQSAKGELKESVGSDYYINDAAVQALCL